MKQFLVVSLFPNAETLRSAIEHRVAPSDRIEVLSDAVWIVGYNGTALDLRQKLVPTDQERKDSFLVAVMTYIAGYGPTGIIRRIEEFDRR